MSKSKNIQIGAVLDTKNGFAIALGSKGSNVDYNFSVELVVKDSTGKVVSRQTDGFVNLVDPRTQPDELLQKGIIDEEVHAKMTERVSKLSEKVKYNLVVPRK